MFHTSSRLDFKNSFLHKQVSLVTKIKLFSQNQLHPYWSMSKSQNEVVIINHNHTHPL